MRIYRICNKAIISNKKIITVAAVGLYSRFNTKDLENAFDPIVDKLNNTDKKLIKN